MKKRRHRPSRLSLPDQHLRNLLNDYPDLHKQVTILRDGKGKDLPDWPDWCLIPMSGWISIATKGEMRMPTPEEINEANRLAARLGSPKSLQMAAKNAHISGAVTGTVTGMVQKISQTNDVSAIAGSTR